MRRVAETRNTLRVSESKKSQRFGSLYNLQLVVLSCEVQVSQWQRDSDSERSVFSVHGRGRCHPGVGCDAGEKGGKSSIV